MTIFLGYDPREAAAYDVAAHSIRRRTRSSPNILRLGLAAVTGILTRPIERRDGKMWCPISQAPMATEFAISRFCVPFVQSLGWALFADSDILCLSDIGELISLADPRYAVQVVKHPQSIGGASSASPTLKMDGQLQTFYARKNWSSVVLWNLEHRGNKRLTIEALNTWPGRDLHAFKWLADDEIGELPREWNHLVGVSPRIENPKLLHYTLGGPWFPNWKTSPFDDIWLFEQANLLTHVR